METNWQLICIIRKSKGVVVQIKDLPGSIALNVNHFRVDVTNKLIVRSSREKQSIISTFSAQLPVVVENINQTFLTNSTKLKILQMNILTE